MAKLFINIGDKFGMLTVLEINKSNCKCLCECGEITYASKGQLNKGVNHGKTSCGCKRAKTLSRIKRVHGLNNHRLFRIYHHMKQRCQNERNTHYFNYGGRGISVCAEWASSFRAFYNWSMANGYQPELTLDRINVNGNYEPENCRWATREIQANNTTTNIFITHSDETLTLKQWSKKLNLDYNLVKARHRRGWSVSRMFTPHQKTDHKDNQCFV
jgi:hypothetical protein